MSIEVKNLTYIYNEGLPHEQVAVDDVSFEIGDESVLGIIGHTGSGKSTLVQHLNGLIKPKSGQVIVDGEDITAGRTDMSRIRKNVGLVFQYPEYQLFEETCYLDVAFGPKNMGCDEEEIQRRVKEAVGLVGLDYEEIKDKSPFDLSGGQKRRVAMAGVIAMKPKILILDEPTAGLDPEAKRGILQLVRDVHEHEKNIIVMISHNMTDVACMCDKVIVMDRGRKLMDGTPSEIFAHRKELESIGLSVPPALELIQKLREREIDISEDAFTAAEAADVICEVLK